jgi:hypothetical protein
MVEGRFRGRSDLIMDLIAFWNTDVRFNPGYSGLETRQQYEHEGTLGAVRKFLSDAIAGQGCTPEEWRRWFNVHVYSSAQMGADALQCWMWLFDGEAPPNSGDGERELRPPPA